VKDNKLRMYWLDAYEDPYNQPGVLYLFGKVLVAPNTFASCCCVVRNLERVAFVLPRERESGERFGVKDVYQELATSVMPRVLRGKAKMRVRPVRKNYCFEEGGVPREETEYLELRYPATCPPLGMQQTGRTFSKIFGTHTSCMENFILSRDLMGPGWIELRNVTIPPTNTSWCKYQVCVNKPVHIVKVASEEAASLVTPRVRARAQ